MHSIIIDLILFESTLSIKTFSMMTINMTIFRIMTLSFKTFGIVTISIYTLHGNIQDNNTRH
jgi:hypothetical protein